jgi:hypothetical protein
MHDAGNVTQNGQNYVDQKLSAEAAAKQNAERREQYRQDNEKYVIPRNI